MKINVNQTQKTAAAIDAAEGRAQVNTISADRLLGIASRAEQELDATGLPLAERKGARFEFRDAGPSAAAYKYSQGATHVMLERGASAWYLISVQRLSVYPRQRQIADLYLIDAQKAAAVRRFADALRVYRTADSQPQQKQPEPVLVRIVTGERDAA